MKKRHTSTHPLDPVVETLRFSPVLKATGERLDLLVEYQSFPKTNEPGYHGTVQDLKTGNWYAVYGMACGLSCYCDAWVVEVPEPAWNQAAVLPE